MLKALFASASLAALALATPARAQDAKHDAEKLAVAYQEGANGNPDR
ncbi:hypothetical protein [Bradyrhizobium jicamae]|nr:hypothetical protein [Bradyrhizobium jicamae]MBR0938815.1 hypothetical protein [Bradyrhizobium jicamae]